MRIVESTGNGGTFLNSGSVLSLTKDAILIDEEFSHLVYSIVYIWTRLTNLIVPE